MSCTSETCGENTSQQVGQNIYEEQKHKFSAKKMFILW